MGNSVAGFGSREAPRHVIAGLRQLNRAADLLYLGAGKWLLCLVSPSSERRATAHRMLDRLNTELKNGTSRSVQAIQQRARFAILMYNGYQAIDAYQVVGAPDSSIVHDYRRALWMLQHRSDSEQVQDAIENAERAERAESSRRDLTDEGRHKDAWKYAFTRSHAVTRNDNSLGQLVPSGRVRHTLNTISKDAA